MLHSYWLDLVPRLMKHVSDTKQVWLTASAVLASILFDLGWANISTTVLRYWNWGQDCRRTFHPKMMFTEHHDLWGLLLSLIKIIKSPVRSNLKKKQNIPLGHFGLPYLNDASESLLGKCFYWLRGFIWTFQQSSLLTASDVTFNALYISRS